MKISEYILGGAIAIAALLSSCDTDNEGAVYHSGNEGLSFTSSVLTDVAVSPADPTFEVEIVRGNAQNALTGSIGLSGTVGNAPFDGITATDYSFLPGEYRTTVRVDVSALSIGQELALTLTITDTDNVSVGGVAETTLNVSKEYNWISLGTGTFTDNWGWGITYNVEILKADGFDRWRVIEPYAESEINDDGEWENWLNGESAPYIEFWLTEDGYVNFNSFYTGLNYDGDSSAPIYVHSPARFGLDSSYNKFLDDKTVQLAPYYYIDGMGGWNMTAYDGIIIITLP